MTVIACRKCGEYKLPDEYHRNAGAPGGLRLECKACRRVKSISDYRNDPGRSKERSSAWAKANPDRARAASKRHADANRESRRALSRAWQKANKAKDAARSAAQRAAVKRATPAWANASYIALFYEMAQLESQRTGRPVHVDHIYPLESADVCGLHVEDNLQLLFAVDNIAKGNKMPNGGGLLL